MSGLTIITQNGGHYIDSREVAAAIAREHKNLLRDIRKYIRIMASNYLYYKRNGELDFTENEALLRIEPSTFFVGSTYINEQNKEMPCFLLTKKGCEMVANKMTGEKGVLFTAAYITKFNEMERREQMAILAPPTQQLSLLNEYNRAAKLIVSVLKAATVPPEHIAGTLKELYKPLGIPVSLEGMTGKRTYTTSEIARELGVMSLNDRAHYLAVGAVISMLEVEVERKVIIPYQRGSSVGVSIEYDESVLCDVQDWFVKNRLPNEISHGGRTYKIKYKTQC